MLILTLDGSTDRTVIGLVRDGEDIAAGIAERDQLAQSVDVLLKKYELTPRHIKAIAIGIGPGSFTGLRVTLAFAKGMARALNISILPVSSLQLVAMNYDGPRTQVAAISSARKGEVHFEMFDRRSLVSTYPRAVIKHSDVVSHLNEDTALLGSGLAKFGAEDLVAVKPFLSGGDDANYPRPGSIARLALEQWDDIEPPEIGSVVPNYGLDFPA